MLQNESNENINVDTSELNSLSFDYIMASKSILWGKFTLGLLATIGLLTFLFSNIFGENSDRNSATSLGAVVLFTLYGGLLAWSFKDRFLPFALGLTLFLLDWVGTILLNPRLSISGIIFKCAIIFYFYKATKSGWELRKIIKKAKEIGVSETELSNHF
jgi:hypothetical protein